MKIQRLLFSWLFLSGAPAAAWAQPPQAAAILQAHGPLPASYEIRGTAELADSEGGLRRVPFALKASGDRSRLEIDGKTFIRQGVFGQWLDSEGRPSIPRRVAEGLREVYLAPFYALGGLSQYGPGPARPGRVALSRRVERNAHLGWQTEAAVVELDFEAAQPLLAEARFDGEEGGQTPVAVRYSDYVRAQGAAVPRRVVRQVGDSPPQTFLIESVDLNASFSDQEFQIVYQQGR